MGKIFEFRPGSYIEKISGTVGVDANTEFHITEKGIALKGNDSSSKVDYGALFELTDNFSVVGWYRSNYKGANDNQLIGSNSTHFQPFRVRPSDNGSWESYFKDDNDIVTSLSVETGLNDGLWHHMMITVDWDGDVLFYLDGEQTGSIAWNSSDGITSTSMTNIYIAHGAVNDYLDGYCGYVAVFDHILTEQERAKHYKEFLQAAPTSKIIR